jgi:predicted nucleic acid-binding Zn ribbon protein
MEEIKSVLKGVLEDLTRKRKSVDLEKALRIWEKTVGPKASAHTKIVHLTKDRIHVNVDNSAWLFELNLKKEGIIKALQKSLKIQDVKLSLGDIREREDKRQWPK